VDEAAVSFSVTRWMIAGELAAIVRHDYELAV
jgi:hypothetical protein